MTELPNDLARIQLLQEPTPLHELPRFASALRTIAEAEGRRGPSDILMKREDLMPLGLGGSKVRNLEYVLGAAALAEATMLVATGRPTANHCRLVAAVAASRGLSAGLLFWGAPPDRPSVNERLIRMHGAAVEFSAGGDGAERARALASFVRGFEERGERPIVVDDLIRGPVGARGAVRAALEAGSQVLARGPMVTHLYCAVATGGTVAGLSVGLAIHGRPCELVAVPTHLAGAASASVATAGIEAVRRELMAAYGSVGTWSEVPLTFDPASAWEEPEPSAGGRAAAGLLARTEGVAVDPVYTARTLAAVIGAARRGDLSGARVLVWNGGGLPALFDEAE